MAVLAGVVAQVASDKLGDIGPFQVRSTYTHYRAADGGQFSCGRTGYCCCMRELNEARHALVLYGGFSVRTQMRLERIFRGLN